MKIRGGVGEIAIGHQLLKLYLRSNLRNRSYRLQLHLMAIHCAAAAEHGGMGPYGGGLIKKESSRAKLKAFPTNLVTSDGIGVARILSAGVHFFAKKLTTFFQSSPPKTV